MPAQVTVTTESSSKTTLSSAMSDTANGIKDLFYVGGSIVSDIHSTLKKVCPFAPPILVYIVTIGITIELGNAVLEAGNAFGKTAALGIGAYGAFLAAKTVVSGCKSLRDRLFVYDSESKPCR